MSNYPQFQQPVQQGYQPAPPPPFIPPKKPWGVGKILGLVAAGLVAFVMLVIVGAVLATSGNDTTANPPAVSKTSEPTTPPTDEPTHAESDPTTEPPVADYQPSTSDVEASWKQKSKKCYGYGLGCLVQGEVKVAADKSAIPDEGTLTVYYTIKGDKDGPIEGSVDLDLGDGTYYPDSQVLTTSSRSKKITVKVTQVEYNN